jgi:REP element-mobilizing transposase RayT
MDQARRQHLQRLDSVWVERPVFLITICTLDRQRVLAEAAMASVVVQALQRIAAVRGWRVGRYVLMPDHIHFFCGPGSGDDLSRFVGGFKQESTRRAWEVGWRGRLWQREFFDQVLRDDDVYEEKWWYVRNNPVRAGLCQTHEEWPWQGEIGVV